jgi:hypothetical protein
MSKSQTAGWASGSPTPAQLKEFFAQVEVGRITKDRLQNFLRGADQVEGDFFLLTTTALTLNELWKRNQDLFHQGSGRWWKDEPFANERGEAGKTLLLRTSVASGSFSKTWDEQQRYLSEGEHVPTTRDLVEGMIAYYRTTGKRLFSDCWVRSQDVSSGGGRVDVKFYSDGVRVRSLWGVYCDSDVGLAVARKSV